jgi:hypothetical protein
MHSNPQQQKRSTCDQSLALQSDDANGLGGLVSTREFLTDQCRWPPRFDTFEHREGRGWGALGGGGENDEIRMTNDELKSARGAFVIVSHISAQTVSRTRLRPENSDRVLAAPLSWLPQSGTAPHAFSCRAAPVRQFRARSVDLTGTRFAILGRGGGREGDERSASQRSGV